MSEKTMGGKTVVITGATSGIGEVAADRLAAKGARIVFVARDRARGEAMLKHLKAIAPGADHKAYYADLSKLAEMKRVGAEIAAAEPHIDVLINNAGATFATRQLTQDGLEMTFAVNHMAYFVLTNLLLPNIHSGARIVSTASDAHKGAKLDFDDLQSSKHFSALGSYCLSKLCNVLFNRELAGRLQGTGITANCFHPGFTATNFGMQNGGWFALIIRIIRNFALSAAQGAETLIYLASSPEVENVSGLYFYKSKPLQTTKESQNDADAKRLWDISAKIAGLGA